MSKPIEKCATLLPHPDDTAALAQWDVFAAVQRVEQPAGADHE